MRRAWRNLRNDKKKDASTSNYKFPKFKNNVGYDELLREKQEEFVVWYEGDSNEILNFYINAGVTRDSSEVFRNSKDYFWATVGKEPDVKCTHSGLPREIINTLVRILGIPKITVSTEVVDEETGKYKEQDNEELSELLNNIIEDNSFYTIHSEDQLPYGMAVGDGAYFINVDPSLSDYPIIEFIDGRNIDFERKANRITAVTARKYYTCKDKAYMLTDTRSTKLIFDEKTNKNKRVATVEYHLFELTNLTSDVVKTEVPLNSIPDTAKLENLEYHNIDTMLAVPVIFNLDKDSGRGQSFLTGKLDLLDDLDQSLSQASNTTRLSTPVDYVPESLIDYDAYGNAKMPKRYDRRYLILHTSRNSVGENMDKVETTQPQLNFTQYNDDQLELIKKILTGIMSPSTLGIDIGRKDNAQAQREKEKATLVTRDYLVDKQTEILSKLFNLVLRFCTADKNIKFKITVNYPEYANPTFENKLSYLAPVYASGGMSEEQYINELWGEALSEEEKQAEIKALKERRQSAMIPFGNGNDDGFDDLMLE